MRDGFGSRPRREGGRKAGAAVTKMYYFNLHISKCEKAWKEWREREKEESDVNGTFSLQIARFISYLQRMKWLMQSECWFFACKISHTRHLLEGRMWCGNSGGFGQIYAKRYTIYAATTCNKNVQTTKEGVFHFQKTRSQNKFGATPSITAFPGKSGRASAASLPFPPSTCFLSNKNT